MKQHKRFTKEQKSMVKELGRLIHIKRTAEGLTLEQASEKSRVSAPTLSRLERYHKMKTSPSIIPDTSTLAALAAWLKVPVELLMDSKLQTADQVAMPELVALHLRADRNLDPEAAERLSDMFRLAYEQFTRPKTSTDDSSVSNRSLDK
jgi:transcriptional regulator with XRE-family HTH domain